MKVRSCSDEVNVKMHTWDWLKRERVTLCLEREREKQKTVWEGGSPTLQDFSWSVSDITCEKRQKIFATSEERGTGHEEEVEFTCLCERCVYESGVKRERDPPFRGSADERRWRAKCPAPSRTSSSSMRLRARCWWGTGGWEWCAVWSSWGSWFTSLGKTHVLYLFFVLFRGATGRLESVQGLRYLACFSLLGMHGK